MTAAKHHRTVWVATGIVIVGLIAGYGFALLKSPEAIGSAAECPLLCDKGKDCPHKANLNS